MRVRPLLIGWLAAAVLGGCSAGTPAGRPGNGGPARGGWGGSAAGGAGDGGQGGGSGGDAGGGGSGGSGGTGPVLSREHARASCEAICALNVTCGSPRDPSCVRSCLESYPQFPACFECLAHATCGTVEICAAGACSTQEPPCGSDADCTGELICENSACTWDPACSRDSQCAGDQLCLAGFCETVECRSTPDCGPHHTCNRNLCWNDGTCDADPDCPAPRICVASICRTRGQCRGDADCGPAMRCDRGACTGIPCKLDGDCPDGTLCGGRVRGGICFSPQCATGAECGSADARCHHGICEWPNCTRNADCSGVGCVDGFCDFVECDTDASCVPSLTCSGFYCALPPPCVEDVHCAGGAVCRQSTCTGACKIDGDCREGESCVQGGCKGAECATTSDCPFRLDCLRGYCLWSQLAPEIAEHDGRLQWLARHECE